MVSDNISFNVLKHVLVPEHHLLTEEEADTILKQMGMTRDQLPKIRNTDAGIKVLESIYGPIAEGRIVKIVRKSETAQEFVAYRLVTKG
ncbi:MAG: DNA-directed RNA polymerase subunit H [Candidatus Methanomethylophilaceae archaeon]|nr:DNA-directed RNA polymerase subunit H [Candidatus Methanomethylophilaceae archaeon]MDD3378880.1 DNA-directed RNA polymerase subunit H [Candidatus Methanomethylophilaceae archaeon]MDY0223985.1 DNA-directed RNA polymerase subunit H [Candidatus Methanomethylophilaceae archaeon]